MRFNECEQIKDFKIAKKIEFGWIFIEKFLLKARGV